MGFPRGVLSVVCVKQNRYRREGEAHPLDPLRKPTDTPTHTPKEPQGNPREPRGSTMPHPCVCVREPRGPRGTLWGR